MLDRETPAERLRIARDWFKLSVAGGAPFTTRTASNFDLLLGSIEADLGRYLLPAERAIALGDMISRWREAGRQLRALVRSIGGGELQPTPEAVRVLDEGLCRYEAIGRQLVDELLALNGLESSDGTSASQAGAARAATPTHKLKETNHG